MGAEPMAEHGARIEEPLEEQVRRGDPDRFAAVMIAPEPMRGALVTLYAFNLEIARTPWRVSEPQIGAIRLRWWLDALGEIYDGKPVRAHELTTPLAALIHAFPPGTAPPRALFESLVEARARDLDPTPISDGEELDAYLEATSGSLTRLAAWLLTRGEENPAQAAAARDAGYAFGAANLLRATPELATRGRMMLAPQPDPDEAPPSQASHEIS
nr:squalene/phytoene synthase family protein [Paracoccaceae bacterium]